MNKTEIISRLTFAAYLMTFFLYIKFISAFVLGSLYFRLPYSLAVELVAIIIAYLLVEWVIGNTAPSHLVHHKAPEKPGPRRTKGTPREDWSWQRSGAPRDARATGFAGWQGGGAKVVGKWKASLSAKLLILLSLIVVPIVVARLLMG